MSLKVIDLFAGAGGFSTGARSDERDRRFKHGLSYTPEYRAWQTMRLRCLNPDNAAYPNYGGRGISVCNRWKESPENFLSDMGRKPSPAHELDRIDNDGGYEPGNCRWVLRKHNDRNRRSNRWVEVGGESKTLAEWAETKGVSPDTISKRLSAGWSAERALNTPARPKAPKGKTSVESRSCMDCGKRGIAGALRCKACSNRSRSKRQEAAA